MIDKQELYELTSKLISFKSVSPDQAGCIDYLQQVLTGIGFTIIPLHRNKTSNFIAIMGSSGPLFAYAGHIDVVPTGDLSKWTCDPFCMTEKDNQVFGRGIADMKGSVAAFIIAAKQFLLSKPKGQIALLITSDEESSAVDGTPVIVEYLKEHNLAVDYCLLGEPSSVHQLGDTIKIGRRGSLICHLEIHGKQGHIAYPERCKNPIHNFAPALEELINTRWDEGTSIFPPTSLQFANINSGLGVANVIPNNLTANFNFRYNNLHQPGELEQKVQAILYKYNLSYNITWISSAKPFFTKPGKLLEVVTQSIKEQLNVTTQPKTDGGTSDGRFLIEVCQEIVEFGLTNTYIHQIDERIGAEELEDLAQTYYLILNKIFND